MAFEGNTLTIDLDATDPGLAADRLRRCALRVCGPTVVPLARRLAIRITASAA
jgi:hypothetical protein